MRRRGQECAGQTSTPSSSTVPVVAATATTLAALCQSPYFPLQIRGSSALPPSLRHQKSCGTRRSAFSPIRRRGRGRGGGGADMSGAGAGDGLMGVAQMRVGRRAADERDLRGVYSRMFVRTTHEMLW